MIRHDTTALSDPQWYHTDGPIWYDRIPGPCINIKTVHPSMGICITKKNRSWDRLIFIMGIPILVRRRLYIETPPGLYYPVQIWCDALALSSLQWYHTYGPIWYDVIPGFHPAYSGIIHIALYDMTWYQGSIQPTVVSYIWPYMIWRDTRVLSSLQWYHTYGPIWYDVIPGFYPAYSGIIHMALYDMTWYQGSIQPTVVSYIWPYMIWRDIRALSSLHRYQRGGPIWYDVIPGAVGGQWWHAISCSDQQKQRHKNESFFHYLCSLSSVPVWGPSQYKDVALLV